MRPALFPLRPGGAAEDVVSLLTPPGRIVLEDRTADPRWGIKGPGAADWLESHGVGLPAVNRHAEVGGLPVLRLGRNDVVLLGDPGDPGPLAALRAEWAAASGRKGYASWRDEAWAWLVLSGGGAEPALAGLTAVDLRPGRIGPDEIAQTRFAQVDAVVLRRSDGVHVFFDVTSTAVVLRRIAQAATASDNLLQESESR